MQELVNFGTPASFIKTCRRRDTVAYGPHNNPLQAHNLKTQAPICMGF